ncbi:NADH-quinone oxidoreductase subunit J [Kyrpidia spormannii]|uniref:NADH-quinone oxidoreductase subunit J n=1 Tax=Kyrpidia spormannii TaxID=2055160 RepID=A0ACA8ZEA4_9BACL|nr:NADH-quinone oxidoreductase subunit J [Kyrpidia spormannii]
MRAVTNWFGGLAWTGQTVAFFVLAVVVVLAAVMLLQFRKVMYMASSIGLVFLGMAGMYVLLGADFLAFAQILIYAGAITILMLFAIMLTRHDEVEEEERAGLRQWLAGLGAVALGAAMLWAIRTTTWPAAPAQPPWPARNSVTALAETLFTSYVVPFELVSVLLTVALVGAVILARKGD